MAGDTWDTELLGRHAVFRRKVRALRDSDSTTVGAYAGSAPPAPLP